MSERHLTDEDIHTAAGTTELRVPPGVPRGTCLKCGAEHVVFYAAQAHDCRIDLKDRQPYIRWLERFRLWGMGVLRSPDAMKFNCNKTISGRQALTFHLQSDLAVTEGTTLDLHVLDHDYYDLETWRGPAL